MKIHAGCVEVGVSIWFSADDSSSPRFLSYAECRTVAALIAIGADPEFAAYLVDRGRFETSSHTFERYADVIEGSCLELLVTVIQTADGHTWDLLGDPSDFDLSTRHEWDISGTYNVCASRRGTPTPDDLVSRVSQLITLRPDLKATAPHMNGIDQPEMRYLGHVEDEPLLLQFRTDDFNDACTRVREAVQQRLDQNGGGDGLVLDRYERRIVAIYGASPDCSEDTAAQTMIGRCALPDWGTQERMVSLAQAWDRASPNGETLDFIWNTFSG